MRLEKERCAVRLGNLGAPDDDEEIEARGQELSSLLDAFTEGEDAARVILEGDEPDLDKIERLAWAMEAFQTRSELWFGWVRPTEREVGTVHRLIGLVRAGAPRKELIEPAQLVYRSIADPRALYALGSALLYLAGEHCEYEPTPGHLRHTLDRGVAFFERGGDVAGFVPGPHDVARIHRLRDLVDAPDAHERRLLAAALWARYPQDPVTEGIRRTTVK